ncbi:MAG: diguanylate cyclase [Candidatus Dormibacteria bacterium]
MGTKTDMGMDRASRTQQSSLLSDPLLKGLLGYFTTLTGVKFAPRELPVGAIQGDLAAEACPLLSEHGACALISGAGGDPDIRHFHRCLGGVGHLVIPLGPRSAAAGGTGAGRIVSGPLSVRRTTMAELLEAGQALHLHPDALATSLREVPEVDAAEVAAFSRLVTVALEKVAGERASRARMLAVPAAFEEVGMHGSREVMRELLAGLVHSFSDADAAVLSTRAGQDDPLEHQPSFGESLTADERGLLMSFTAEVVAWISQTGYPISFPDLGGSAWRKHVLDGQDFEGSLVAVPVKVPGDGQGWWTAYYRLPMTQMEDQLHRLTVLAAHSSQTLAFASQLEASESAALTDALTQLGNRRFLSGQLERELARSARGRYPVSMIMLDIDDFKAINDTYGHRAGDDALRAVAGALLQPLRRSNTVCRYGGDEFCVLIPECSTDEALGVARRLLQEVEGTEVRSGSGDFFTIHVSAGVGTFEPDDPGSHDLFEMADRALLGAKRSGKNQVLVSTQTAGPQQRSEPGRLD